MPSNYTQGYLSVLVIQNAQHTFRSRSYPRDKGGCMIEGLHVYQNNSPAEPPVDVPARVPRWRLVVSILISLLILVLLYLNREPFAEALSLARTANPLWLAPALGMVLISYLISSQVFRVVLKSMGY